MQDTHFKNWVSVMSLAVKKSELRKLLRAKRRALAKDEQLAASIALIQVIRPLLARRKIRRIAVYLAMDGELDLEVFIHYCWQRGIEVYLPAVNRFKPTLWFARYESNCQLFNNRFGIPEPLKGATLRPWQLDLVLLPLVGFDQRGGRLGMGGGFYDRTFATASRWPKSPTLFGVAHECQKVDAIPLEAWDIQLDGILTDKKHYRVL